MIRVPDLDARHLEAAAAGLLILRNVPAGDGATDASGGNGTSRVPHPAESRPALPE